MTPGDMNSTGTDVSCVARTVEPRQHRRLTSETASFVGVLIAACLITGCGKSGVSDETSGSASQEKQLTVGVSFETLQTEFWVAALEASTQTNGLPTPCGAGLVGALTAYGLDAISAAEKEEMRQLAMRGGPWTPAERSALRFGQRHCLSAE